MDTPRKGSQTPCRAVILPYTKTHGQQVGGRYAPGQRGTAAADKSQDQYNAANVDINAMRRLQYNLNKDRINAQKRAAYAARKLRASANYGIIK